MAYRYIGNKTRLLPHILNSIEHIVPPGSVVADLMCGTASVAAGLRQHHYSVIASDIMTFSVHHARVRLLLDRSPYFLGLDGMKYQEVLDELQHLDPIEDLFVREYSPAGIPLNHYSPRLYFTPENAGMIDAIRQRLNGWNHNGLLSEKENSLLRHDLIMAVNNVANIAGTYGHFRSKWSETALRPLKLERTHFERGPSIQHKVFHGSAEDIAPLVSADLCYLDPPYTKRQYAANYHLIETLARGDDPEPIGISGLRNWWDQYSDFCSKRRIADAFAAVIGKADCPYFLISYSEDGLLTKEHMIEILQEFGSVNVEEIEYKRFRSNDSPLAKTLMEYLFHLKVVK